MQSVIQRKAADVATSTALGLAASIDQPGHVTLRSATFAAPKPNQVRVRLEGCGICASNLPVWQGRAWFDYPLEAGAPGHEGWGVIEAVGSEVHSLSVGDRVAVLSYHAFATHDIAEQEQVVRLPNELADQPFPGEPLGCAMNVLERSQIRPSETVAIVGVGFLGALLIRLAKSAGARVVSISHRPFSREIAHRCGADVVLSTDDDVAAEVSRFADGDLCDCVIEATGLQKPLDLAGGLVRTRGRLVVAGFHQDGPRQVDMQSWNWRGLDVVNAHERAPEVYINGIRRAVDAVIAGDLVYSDLLTHCFALDELGEALQMANDRPEGFLKAWVRC